MMLTGCDVLPVRPRITGFSIFDGASETLITGLVGAGGNAGTHESVMRSGNQI